jgi:hypothetical protein
MASRPFVTGLVAAAMAATALHVASGPPTHAGNSTELAAPDTRIKGLKSPEADALGKMPWAELLDKNPEAAGRLSGGKEFQAAVCQAIALPEQGCGESASPAGSGGPLYTDQDTGAPQVMFALVPDPLHTHLALWFDRSMDALEDAMVDSGWEYQTHWMPWSPSGGGGDAATRFKDGEQERLFRDGQEEFPGVIVFRPRGAEPSGALQAEPGLTGRGATHPIVLLLIGDSPTSGINQTQFQEAVRQFSTIAPQQSSLKIIGPNFTGSGPSLHALLAAAKQASLANVKVDVASGSVSDWRCGNFLPHGVVDPAQPQCTDATAGYSGAPDSFVSFDADFAWEVQQTEIFLHEKGGLEYSEIAQLTEDESGFGALANEGKAANEILKLTFPRNISHLRSAYEKNGVWGFGGSSSGSGTVSLSLDFGEGRESDDSVPEFAPKQMPVSQEATLGQVSTILEQRHIKAVLLSSTDVLDALFVAQILARQAPNLIVIVRGTDVLFLRSGDSGVYHNMYAVGAWPLIPKNYFWSQPEIKLGMRNFPSDHAEGVYTATRYLLVGAKNLSEVQDYSSPVTATQRPPLWLLSIGHGAYWPLALLPDAANTDEPPKSLVARSTINLPPLPKLGAPNGLGPEDNRPPVTQLLLILLGCLLSLMHAGKCLDLRLLQGVGASYRINEPSARRPKLLLQLAISCLGLLTICLLCGPAELPQRWSDCSWAIPLLLGAWALSLATASSLLELLAREPELEVIPASPLDGPPPGPADERRRMPYLTRMPMKLLVSFGFLAAAAGVWAIEWAILPAAGPAAEGLKIFFVYRSRYPLSGASPVLPLLLSFLGLAVYLLNHLGRFTFGPDLAPRLPVNVSNIPNCPSEGSMAKLTSLLAYPAQPEAVQRKLTILGAVVALTSVVVSTIHLAPRMFEGRALSLACGCALFLVVVALLWDLTMATYLWRQLKNLFLDPLESSSLRAGFSSISGLTWKDLWLLPQSHTGLSQYRTLSRALEQAGRRVMQVEADAGGMTAPLAAMYEDHRQRRPMAKVVESFGKVQVGLASTAEVVLAELKASWDGKADRITVSDGLDAGSEERKAVEPGTSGSGEGLEAMQKAWRADILCLFPGARFIDHAAAGEAPPAATMQRIREEWVALVYVHYVRMILIQIRSRILTTVILYLLLVLSVTCYPYLNRHVLLLALSGLFGVLAMTAVSTYASINRDPILSRTTENRPGSLDMDFYWRAASMVGIPLLGLIASQFPEVSSFLFSWIEPGMAAVKP